MIYLVTFTNDKIPGNCKHPLALIQAAQNQKETNKGSLVKVLKLKIGLKVIIAVNIGTQDRPNNGQAGNIRHIAFVQGSVCKMYAKSSDKLASSKAMKQSYLGRQNSIKNVKQILIRKGSTFLFIKCTQFPLTLARPF